MLHTTHYQRPNGDDEDIEITVEFTLTGGSEPSGLSGPPENYDPGEAPEFLIDGAYLPDGSKTELTDAEAEKVEAEVMDRLGDFDDGGEYFEDYE